MGRDRDHNGLANKMAHTGQGDPAKLYTRALSFPTTASSALRIPRSTCCYVGKAVKSIRQIDCETTICLARNMSGRGDKRSRCFVHRIAHTGRSDPDISYKRTSSFTRPASAASVIPRNTYINSFIICFDPRQCSVDAVPI